ncbi:MAG: hypothetical protein R3F49_05175 [Planctomycetota bacterium]
MKHLALLLVATLSSTLVSLAPAQGADSLTASCRAAFEALRADDVDALEATFPTLPEFEAFLDSMLAAAPEAAQAAQRKQLSEQGGVEGTRAIALETLRRRFASCRSSSGAEFDWTSARFVAPLPMADPRAPFDQAGYEIHEVEFLVEAGGSLWSFGGYDVLSGPRGWVFLEGPSFRGEWARVDNDRRSNEAEALRAQLDMARAELSAAEHRYETERIGAERDLAQLHAELAQLRAEREQLESEREHAALEIERVREESERSARHLRYENEMFRAAIDRLRHGTQPPVQGAALPDWCPDEVDPALRAALLAPMPFDAEGLTQRHISEVVSLAMGVETLALPTAVATLDEGAGCGFAAGETVAETLTREFAAHGIWLSGSQVVIGSTAERALMSGGRLPNDVAALTALDRGTTHGAVEDYTLLELVNFIDTLSGVNTWMDDPTADACVDATLGVYSSSRLTYRELLELVLARGDLQTAWLDGVLLINRERVAPVPELDPAVAARLPSATVQVAFEAETWADRLTTLGALLGLDLGALPRELDEADAGAAAQASSFSLRDISSAALLRLTEYELGGSWAWRVTEQGLTLAPRE